MNVPKLNTGTAVAPQYPQNTEVTETDLTDSWQSSNVVTIAGNQTVSQQLLDQSPVAFDAVVFRDLVAAFAQETDAAVLNG